MFGPIRISSSNRGHPVTLKVWLKTDLVFEQVYSLDATFADVKLQAIQHLSQQTQSTIVRRSSFSSFTSIKPKSISCDDEIDNYKLISIESKRPVQDKTLLKDGRIKDGDEFMLFSRRKIQPKTTQRLANSDSINLPMIEEKTETLPRSDHALQRSHRRGHQQEFRTDLNRILFTLLETSQKLIWCHPDAENIFHQAEEFLLQSSLEDSNDSRTTVKNREESVNQHINIDLLTDMGFTSEQARRALKRTRYDVQAAMELLLVNPDIEETIEHEESSDIVEQKPEVTKSSLFNRNGKFVSLRKFRQAQFRPNPQAIRALKEMGFETDDIIEALRFFNNDKNAACNYLLGDKDSQIRMQAANQEQSIDPSSSIYRAIMENPIIQKTLNNPNTFFILLQISENPALISHYMSDPDIGNMLVQISRIYHSDNENTNSQEPSPLVTSHLGGRTSTDDDDDDSD